VRRLLGSDAGLIGCEPEMIMKKTTAALPLFFLSTLFYPGQARAEWFYLGAQVGGQYFDMDALSGGEVFDQALEDATEDFNINNPDIPDIDQPTPRHYSAEGAFVWGIYTGVSLGQYVRIGARMTHSFMEVRGEGEELGEADEISFDMDLLTIIGELQIRIPIRFLVPFIGVGVGYAYLGTDGQIVSQGSSQTFEGYSVNALDAQAHVGLDFNIGDHFSIGAAAHFSFIGFYYNDPEDPTQTEAAWGFVNDYMIRATLRI
jgi:hypothetical protein